MKTFVVKRVTDINNKTNDNKEEDRRNKTKIYQFTVEDTDSKKYIVVNEGALISHLIRGQYEYKNIRFNRDELILEHKEGTSDIVGFASYNKYRLKNKFELSNNMKDVLKGKRRTTFGCSFFDNKEETWLTAAKEAYKEQIEADTW